MKKGIAVFFVIVAWVAGAEITPERMTFILRDRAPDGIARQRAETWDPKQTAIIISDMWADHPCVHATARLRELAAVMNKTLAAARERGILIIFAPSNSEMDTHYKDLPARQKTAHLRKGFGNAKHWHFWEHADGNHFSGLTNPSEKGAKFPVQGGENNCEESKVRKPDFRQTELLDITDADILTDDFEEIKAYFKEVGIKNVILMGVHTDMCVIGRPFGCRAMRKLGYNTVLCRDMTDSAYNCASRLPNVPDHYLGLELVIEYIERYICPTITSVDITGAKEFRFKEDRYQ
jgi:nicotinamidase-related amidase